jgi:hypothetical protein
MSGPLITVCHDRGLLNALSRLQILGLSVQIGVGGDSSQIPASLAGILVADAGITIDSGLAEGNAAPPPIAQATISQHCIALVSLTSQRRRK